MSGSILAAITTWSTLSLEDENMHDGTITFYAKVVNHLLRSCDADAVIAKADKVIRSFKQGSRTRELSS